MKKKKKRLLAECSAFTVCDCPFGSFNGIALLATNET